MLILLLTNFRAVQLFQDLACFQCCKTKFSQLFLGIIRQPPYLGDWKWTFKCLFKRFLESRVVCHQALVIKRIRHHFHLQIIRVLRTSLKFVKELSLQHLGLEEEGLLFKATDEYQVEERNLSSLKLSKVQDRVNNRHLLAQTYSWVQLNRLALSFLFHQEHLREILHLQEVFMGVAWIWILQALHIVKTKEVPVDSLVIR